MADLQGKDFIAHVQAKSDDIEQLLSSSKPSSSSSAASASTSTPAASTAKKSSAPLFTTVFLRFLALRMMVRVDRVLKVAPKGRKSLPKWPKKLEMHREQEMIDSETDAFYAVRRGRGTRLSQRCISVVIIVWAGCVVWVCMCRRSGSTNPSRGSGRPLEAPL